MMVGRACWRLERLIPYLGFPPNDACFDIFCKTIVGYRVCI